MAKGQAAVDEYLQATMLKWEVVEHDTICTTHRMRIPEGTLWRTRFNHREGIALVFVPRGGDVVR